MLSKKSKHDLLNNLSLQVLDCVNCELSQSRTCAVPGMGSSDSPVMFIGEAPGYHEDISGFPFVGSAGKLLTDLLNEISMSRDSVYITNIVKCRPPENRNPYLSEIKQCESYLSRQISMIDPLLIVPLGKFAMNYFIPGELITSVSGTIQEINDRHVYPLLHPAAALRKTEYKNRLKEDFLKIPSILDKLTSRQYLTDSNPSFCSELS